MNQNLQALMDGAALSESQTHQLLDAYPYFAYPAIRFALSHPDAPAALLSRTRRHAAVSIGSTDALIRIFGPYPEVADAEFYPDQATPELDTDSTIDAFLARFGSNAPLAATPAAPIPVEAPAIDYAAILAAEQEPLAPQPAPLHAPQPAEAPKTDSPEPPRAPRAETNQSPALSESLARLMIKNHNYAKALEIITDLSARNPQKSIYFADQIRFLRKLIINDNYLHH